MTVSPADAGAGDTFDLVSVAGEAVPQPMPAGNDPCPVERVFSGRYVFRADSTYESVIAAATGCATALAVPMVTRHAGRYDVHRDTLTVYLGDGDEEFQQFIARRWADSLVGEGRTGAWRYRRRGRASSASPP